MMSNRCKKFRRGIKRHGFGKDYYEQIIMGKDEMEIWKKNDKSIAFYDVFGVVISPEKEYLRTGERKNFRDC